MFNLNKIKENLQSRNLPNSEVMRQLRLYERNYIQQIVVNKSNVGGHLKDNNGYVVSGYVDSTYVE